MTRIYQRINFNQSFQFFLPRPAVRLILASIYSMAFIVTPYWDLLGGKKWSVAAIACLLLTIGFGIAWSYFSAGDIRLKIPLLSLLLFFFILAFLAVINFNALNINIPWRGDENYHIHKTVSLVQKISFPAMLLYLILTGLIFYKVSQKPWGVLRITAILIVGIIPFFIFGYRLSSGDPTFLLRYPFVNYWFFAITPFVAGFIKSPYYEILYRIIPLFSVAIIVWIIQYKVTSSGMMKIVWGIACALIPTILYNATILYLELPAVVLMLVVCFRIKGLLEKDFNRLKQDPGWYALILIGFIKETTISFLFCFIACRILIYIAREIQSRRRQSPVKNASEKKARIPFLQSLSGEILIVFSTSFPIIFYLLFRSFLVSTRSFVPHFSDLLNISAYQAVGRSFIDQFGPFFFLFLAGWILLMIRKEYISAGFFMLLILFIPLFHVVDNIDYAGYSRFNLFILAPILVGSSVFINWMIERSKVISSAAVLGIILLNLFMSPVYSNGSRVPFWGIYLHQKSLHYYQYYPYQDALTWIKYSYQQPKILFAGANFHYAFDFYFNKLNWFPDLDTSMPKAGINDSQALARARITAEKQGEDVILFQVLGKTVPQFQPDGTFDKVKIFQDGVCVLLVLYK
jgi:hypothetical protein